MAPPHEALSALWGVICPLKGIMFYSSSSVISVIRRNVIADVDRYIL